MTRFPNQLFFALLIICSCKFGLAQDLEYIHTDSLFVALEKAIASKNHTESENLILQLRETDPKDDDLYKIRLNFFRASHFIAQDDDEFALKLLLDNIELPILKSDSNLYIKHFETIGRILARANDFQDSKSYFEIALAEATKQKDSLQMASLYLNIGSTFQLQQKIDSSSYYYEKVLHIYPKITKDKGTLATAYSNLIGVSLAFGEFDVAEAYGIKSLEIHKQRKDTLKMAGVLANLGSICMYTRELDKANEYYFETLELIHDSGELKGQEIKAITLDNISQVFYLQGEFKKGYDYLFESVGVDKELNRLKIESKITEIETKFHVDQEEKDAQIERVKRHRAELIIYFLLGALAIVLVVLWLYYRNSELKKEKILLEQQKLKMHQQNQMERIKNESQIKILNANIDGKEAERRHIADVLNENVGSLLAKAKEQLRIENTKKGVNNEVLKIEQIVDETIENVNSVSHKLVSPVLLKFGLASSIEDLCEKYSGSKLVFNSESNNVKRYEQRFEIRIHNVVEELIHNILDRGTAKLANILVNGSKKDLHITISDNGDGLDWNEVLPNNEFGLHQIKARIKMMKGTFEIETSTIVGTQIAITVPIPE